MFLFPRFTARIGRATFSAAIAMGLLATSAQAQITVTMTDDVVDFGGLQQVSDLPGPDGMVSFREACTAANNTAGPQTIAFAIPSGLPHQWSAGVAILYMDFYSFFLTDDETTVDFTTQTAFTGDTNPNGNEVGIYVSTSGVGGAAIWVNADRCVIKGLDRITWGGYGVRIGGNDNRVIGCTISGPLFAGVYINGTFGGAPALRNVVGGTSPGEGNDLDAGNSGVRIDGPARDNLVIGNTLSGSFYGVEVRSPTCCPGNEAVNNRIGGPTPEERNVIRGAGKYSHEGFPDGGQVKVEYSPDNIVEGNYIGVNADGRTLPATQRGPVGVEVRSAPGTIVRDNVIGGIKITGVNHAAGKRYGDAIKIMGDCVGSIIQGNLIGVDATASFSVPNRAGITAVYWSVDGMPVTAGPITIGGQLPGDANIIANSELHGVQIEDRISGVRVSGNSIHDNGTLGIDLLIQRGGEGPTLNDAGDGDTGANGLQNFPVLLDASSGATTSTVRGELDSLANRAFVVEFFANADCDPSGYGEGGLFLGSTTVTTDAGGFASFIASLATAVPPGHVVTATATLDQNGDTSEFSVCIPVADALDLTATPLKRGAPADLTVANAIPGERIYFLYTMAGMGAGPCPGSLGGLCLDLLNPITIAGDSLADNSGVAVLRVPIPSNAPLVDVYLQAVVRRGTGGAASLKSNPVSTTIQP